MCVFPILCRMKPYKIPCESPFFMLQDGAIQSVLQNNQVWESYEDLNSCHGSKNWEKLNL